MDLNGEHAVITGASAGIGAAIARELWRRGARVTLVARRASALEALAEELGDRALVLPADLVDDATGWLERAETAHGPVGVLVNNAGVQVIAPSEGVDVERGERSLALNLEVPLRLTRAVLPSMLSRGRGAIVNVASMAALAPTPGMTYYNAGKAGLDAASEAMRGELRGRGPNVVTVYPGIIETDMGRAGLAAYEASAGLNLQPRGDVGVLARRIADAVERDRARVVYPRIYGLARWFPTITRWVMDRFSPALRTPDAPPAESSEEGSDRALRARPPS